MKAVMKLTGFHAIDVNITSFLFVSFRNYGRDVATSLGFFQHSKRLNWMSTVISTLLCPCCAIINLCLVGIGFFE